MTINPTLSAHEPQPRWRLAGVPVFVYHGLADEIKVDMRPNERKYWLRNVQFREHVDHISRNGYRASLLKEFVGGKGEEHAPRPDVILTFDDGRASDYRLAFPYLLEKGLKAEFFVNTANIGAPGFVGWQEASEMQRAGMSIQSHSHDHLDLSRLPGPELGRQLKVSKQTLEDRLGSAVDFLAAPHGRLNRRVVEEAQRLGYRAVCSTRSLPARKGARELNRVVLYRHTGFREFQRLLDRNLAGYFARIARAPLYWPKRVLLWFQPLRSSDELPKEMA